MNKLTLMFLAFLIVSCASLPHPISGETLEIDAKRAVYVTGVIQGAELINKADDLVEMAEESSDPIYLIINSPGGQVLPGIQFISAMNTLQKRGVKFKCFVPMLAASMAFQIFAECDERYTLNNALHLWHPVRISGTFSALTPKALLAIYEDLKAWEDMLVKALKRKLNISDELFQHHYDKETLHLASNLKELDPNFLTIVNDVRGISLRFSMSDH